jgi:hypothetical protein
MVASVAQVAKTATAVALAAVSGLKVTPSAAEDF